VRDLRRSGVGVIYISHRLEEIFVLADRVTVLRDGESVRTLPLGARSPAAAAPSTESATPQVFQDAPLDPSRPDSTSGAPVDETMLIRLMVGREVSHSSPPAAAAPGRVVLSLRNVGCEAGGIRGVTLEVCAGEVVGVAGLVGAGRTELARVLFGVTPADEGEILLESQLVRLCSPQEAVARGLAYVPEDRRRHGVILQMPVAANITMASHQRLFPAGWLRFGAERRLALDYIRELGVKPTRPQAPAGSLSGGNQQKTALARWLATRPKLLILDEPTQGVDVGAKAEIHRIIRRLAREGLAVLLISSDLPEVLGMSDRIAVMRGGTITAMLPGHCAAPVVMAAALGQSD